MREKGTSVIVVFGAAGTCGAAVVRALSPRRAPVRGFIRSEARAVPAQAAGADEVVMGDLRQLASLRTALKDARAVFYVAPRFAADEAAVGRMVIREAVRAGVERFVYQSALHASAQWLLHHEQKRQVEEALYESGMEFTILQPARFMHLVVPPWRKIAASGIYAEPFSADAPVADVDYEDVAEVAARALTESGYGYATFELCAAGMLTRRERVVLLSEAMGHPIQSADITIDEWLAKAGITDPYEREARTRMFEYYDRHGLRGGNSRVLQALIDREPASFSAFLARTAARMQAQEATQLAWARGAKLATKIT